MRDLSAIGVEVTWAPPSPTSTSAVSRRTRRSPALRRIEAATKIWAAGVQASPLGRLLAEATGAEVDRAGRVKVEPTARFRAIPRCSSSAT